MGLIVHSCKCCSLLPYVWVQPKVSYSTSTNCKNIGKHLFLHILKWMAMNTVNDHLYFVYCEQNLVLWTISLTHSEYQHWGIVVCTTCYGCRDKQPRATEQHSHWIGTAGHKKKTNNSKSAASLTFVRHKNLPLTHSATSSAFYWPNYNIQMNYRITFVPGEVSPKTAAKWWRLQSAYVPYILQMPQAREPLA